ncbi:hypothetical protein IT41_02510 [Paracoccus halophilus]|uniref:Uncharacterized protein n=1 Tax=Paracoccus halophilus TaxID=376733 RepID=A0A099F8Z9_9RHOB|nr:hypothetical protein IT41_02510 [Paracoccus halophilus]
MRDQTGNAPIDATIEFRLRHRPADSALVAGGGVTIAPVGDGNFTARLYREPGLPTVYDVIMHHRPFTGAEIVSEDIGPIVIEADGTYPIASLMPLKIPPGATDTAEIRQGDRLEFGGVWLDEWNRPINHAGIAISSSMLGPDGTTRALAVTKGAPESGSFAIAMDLAATMTLPVGTHQIDVKFSAPDRVVRTITSQIEVKTRTTP